MKLTLLRESLLKPLQLAASVTDKRGLRPILAHVLLDVTNEQLSVIGTDLELELVGKVPLTGQTQAMGRITLPARKLVEICRSLPDLTSLTLTSEGERVTVQCAKSRFVLATLPAEDFPAVGQINPTVEFTLSQRVLRLLLETSHFSMAQQDVRYYLNGLFMQVENDQLITVATDGHRMSVGQTSLASSASPMAVIVPRKGVLELMRLIGDEDIPVTVLADDNHLCVKAAEFVFTTKLVEGRFPDYQRLVPQGGDKILIANRDELKQAITRAAILSNEKFRGVRLLLAPGLLRICANNLEQEESEEEITVHYDGEPFEVVFNAGYLLDILAVLNAGDVKITLRDETSGALVEGEVNLIKTQFVVMPLQL